MVEADKKSNDGATGGSAAAEEKKHDVQYDDDTAANGVSKLNKDSIASKHTQGIEKFVFFKMEGRLARKFSAC